MARAHDQDQEICEMTDKDARKNTLSDLGVSTMQKKQKESAAAAKVRKLITPEVQATFTISKHSKDAGDIHLQSMLTQLYEHSQAVNNGDLKRGESMLTAQAHTLDAVFNNFARLAALNMGKHIDACETYLKLALRAQSQCRAAWETLAAIKNQPIVYARQANVTTGPQQINNGIPSRARENENEQSKLLEAKPHERLDTGTAGAAGGIDQTMETVGKVHRAANAGR